MAGKAYIHCSFPRKTDGYELGREGQRWTDKPRNRSAPPPASEAINLTQNSENYLLQPHNAIETR